jgi:hypothetical protein
MYTVIINGVPVQCETAADAIELTRQAASEGFDSVKPTNVVAPLGPSRWTEQRIRHFFHEIGGAQRRLIDTLLDASDPLTDDQLLQRLSLDGGRALGGVLTGLLRNAKKVGADPNDLFSKRTVTIGDKQGYEYTVTPTFRAAAEKWRT